MDTKKLRQKILDLAIHGRLVPQDPADEPASELLKRIRAEKEQMVKAGKAKVFKTIKSGNQPFTLPKSWEWCTVGELAPSLQYGTAEKSSSSGKVAVLRMGNITRKGEINFDDLVYSSNDNDIEKLSLKPGDLLFNRTNSSEWVGKCAIYRGEIPAIYAGYIIKMTPIGLNTEYVNLVMISEYERDWCNQVKTDGINQSNINSQKLASFFLPIPPLAEQQRIVAKVEELFAQIDIIEQSETALEEAKAKAHSKILDLAIHGKLVPSEGEWEGTTLQNLCKITMGQSPCGDSINYEEGVEFHQGKLCFGEKYLNKSTSYTKSPLKLARAHSIVLCVRAPVGIPNITDREICIGRGLCSIECSDKVDLNYLYYLLLSKRHYYESLATGTTFKAISADIIKRTPIPLPPLAEQKRIVAKIEELFELLK